MNYYFFRVPLTLLLLQYSDIIYLLLLLLSPTNEEEAAKQQCTDRRIMTVISTDSHSRTIQMCARLVPLRNAEATVDQTQPLRIAPGAARKVLKSKCLMYHHYHRHL